MKSRLATLILLAIAASGYSATVTGSLEDIFGATDATTRIRFTPLQTPIFDGGKLTLDVSRSASVDTNGEFTVWLKGGIYDADFGAYAGKPIRIRVPWGDTNTYDFQTLAKLGINGGVVFSTNGWERVSSRFIPGSGVTAVTNSPGSIYESLTLSANPAGISKSSHVEVGSVIASNIWNSANVKFWGATGNGQTDDTEALQSALDSVTVGYGYEGVAGGSTITFPEGIYVVTNSLHVKNGTRIVGASKTGTMILNTGTNSTFVFDPVLTGIDNWVSFENLNVDYAAHGGVGTAAFDIPVGDAGGVTPIFRHIGIWHAYNGIKMTFTINAVLEDVYINNSVSDGILAPWPNNAATLSACYTAGNGGAGINGAFIYSTLNGLGSDRNSWGYLLQLNGGSMAGGCEQNSVGGIQLSNCINSTVTVYVDPKVNSGNAFTVHGGKWVTLENCQVETLFTTNITGYALFITNAPQNLTVRGGIFPLTGAGCSNDVYFSTISPNGIEVLGDIRARSLGSASAYMTVGNPDGIGTIVVPFTNGLKFTGYASRTLGSIISADEGVNTLASKLSINVADINGVLQPLIVAGTTNNYVGIGTNTPGYKLDVLGDVGAQHYYGDGSHLTFNTTTNATGTSVVGQFPIVVKGITYYIDLKK